MKHKGLSPVITWTFGEGKSLIMNGRSDENILSKPMEPATELHAPN
jgi:hypothetical protein